MKDGTADLQANAHTSSGQYISGRSKPTGIGKENARDSRATKPYPPPSEIPDPVELFAETETVLTHALAMQVRATPFQADCAAR